MKKLIFALLASVFATSVVAQTAADTTNPSINYGSGFAVKNFGGVPGLSYYDSVTKSWKSVPVAGIQLPAPTSSTLGGVQAATGALHQFQIGVSTGGSPLFAQPQATDVSGLALSATTDTTNAGNITAGTLGTGRLPVIPPANGGCGVASLSGILKGNGTSPCTAAVAGTDFLSPAIASTITALQTFNATAGGIIVNGTPNISRSYVGLNENFGFIGEMNAASATLPEAILGLSFTSSIGAANLTSAFKEVIGGQMTVNAGSADGWFESLVMNIGAGGTQRGGIVTELDLNNNWGNYLTIGPQYAANLYLTGTNTGGYSTCAICIQFASNQSAMWNYGIAFGPPGFNVFNGATILDQTNSPESIQIQGSHGIALDTSGMTGTYNDLLANGQLIASFDNGGTPRNLITLNTSNVFQIGDTVHDMIIAPHERTSGGALGAPSGCGTGATVTGNDRAGRLTTGTTGLTNTCTVAWAAAYNTAPSCAATDQSLMSTSVSFAPSATGFTIGNLSGASAADHVISWSCNALNGG